MAAIVFCPSIPTNIHLYCIYTFLFMVFVLVYLILYISLLQFLPLYWSFFLNWHIARIKNILKYFGNIWFITTRRCKYQKSKCNFYKRKVKSSCQAGSNITCWVFDTFCLAMSNHKFKIEEYIIDVDKFILFFCPILKQFQEY